MAAGTAKNLGTEARLSLGERPGGKPSASTVSPKEDCSETGFQARFRRKSRDASRLGGGSCLGLGPS